MIRIRNIKIPINKDNKEQILKKINKLLKSKISDYKIVKKSLDARDKNNILYIYQVDVFVEKEDMYVDNKSIFKVEDENYQFNVSGEKELKEDIVIVGSGPAGLMCAYLLCENGYKVTIIEQGEQIEKRVETVEEFFETNKLNKLSNVQFGEGGAGTFSDGKLNTLVKDKKNRGKKVFEIFVENGAPKEIMYLQNPHIGTDILRKVIINIRKKIISMGGSFKYNTKCTNLIIKNNEIIGIEVNNKDIINCNCLVLAIGHSARDTFYMLNKNNINMKSKPFAVGLRIEHLANMINESQYGKDYKLLPPASYKLTYKSKSNRSVYTFCMCPGGYVVNASSEDKRLVINGMSNYKRNEVNSNSAIVVSVDSKDYGESLFSGLEFQRKLEEEAYKLGRGLIPIQLFKDYKNDTKTTVLGKVVPNTKGKYTYSNLRSLFSSDITNSIIEAIEYFDTKIKGFSNDDSILLGVEARTSSPLTIKRDENFETNVLGIYPCGEGAGYAGGITTASLDGIKVAEEIAKKYKINK